MYIGENRDRVLNLITAFLIFAVLASLTMTKSPLFTLGDSLLQGFFTGMHFNHPIFNQIVSFFSNPILGFFYVFIMWFILWGFKHKLIAFWIVCTYVTGETLFMFVRKIVAREQPLNHTNATHGSFPSHHVFTITLVFMFIFVAVVPFIESRIRVTATVIGMWLFTILVVIARIQLNAIFPFDAVGAILLAYTWVEIWEIVYLRIFVNLQNGRAFSHSDYN